MTVSIAPEAAAGAENARADFLTALADAREWFADHPDARLPQSPVVNVRARGANREAKLADLRAIAASWGVPVLVFADGTQYAECVFGPLTFEAHVPPAAQGTTSWLDAARARRTGSETAA